MSSNTETAETIALRRADAEIIHRVMVELFHAGELLEEETSALMSLSRAGNFGRPVPNHASGP